MAFSDDMNNARTPEQINGLQQKYKRTHFSHFSVAWSLKPQRRKIIKGRTYAWKFGKWRLLS